MTNREFTEPLDCISYYVSSKSNIDNKHSYCYWFRGKLIRIIADKPFARGDMLRIHRITQQNSSANVTIEATVNSGEYRQHPVLNFVSTRLVYNPYSEFEFTTTPGVELLNVIEQTIDNNYSVCFVALASSTGVIHAVDKNMNNYFDININLQWNK